MATHRVLKSLGTLALLMIGVGGSSALGADTERPYRKGVVPDSTTIRASFDTEKDSGPDMLLDANEKTRGGKSLVHSWMSPSGLKSEYANSVTLETQRTGTTTTTTAADVKASPSSPKEWDSERPRPRNGLALFSNDTRRDRRDFRPVLVLRLVSGQIYL